MTTSTPGATATFRDVDAWLIDRGWSTTDSRRWEWRSEHKGKLIIASYSEAIKIQRRRDRAQKGRT